MKVLLIKFSVSLFTLLLATNLIHAQEYDDIYFRKSDRKKIIEQRKKEKLSYRRDSYLYNEIKKLEEEDSDELLSDYNDRENDNRKEKETGIVEKHYYYSDPSTQSYQNFDNDFWDDPYLYQGNIYDPYYNRNSYQPSYSRFGWNASFSFGNRWNRPRWRSGYYNDGYSSYGYYDAWNYNSWYYNSYWCPPSYFNRRNVVVYNSRYANDGGIARGIIRGRRSSRNSSINNGRRNTSRSSNISSRNNIGGKDEGGRYETGSRTYRNSSRTYNTGTSPNRRSSNYKSNERSTNTSKSGSYVGRSSNTRSSGFHRSRSRSSSNGNTKRSSTKSRSSSSKSKSRNSSRSSRTKKDK